MLRLTTASISLGVALVLSACGDSPGGPSDASSIDASVSVDAADGTLVVATGDGELRRGTTTELAITVDRGNGVTGAVEITVSGLPTGTSAAPLTIAADAGQGTLALTAAVDAVRGAAAITLHARAADDTEDETTTTLTVRSDGGTFDPAFGSNGLLTISGGAGRDLTLLPDNTVVVLGLSGATFTGDAKLAFIAPDATTGTFATALTSVGASGLDWVPPHIIITGSRGTGLDTNAIAAAFTVAGAPVTTWGSAGELRVVRSGNMVAEHAVDLGAGAFAMVADGSNPFAVKVDDDGAVVGSATTFPSEVVIGDSARVGDAVIVVGYSSSVGRYAVTLTPGSAGVSANLAPENTSCGWSAVRAVAATRFRATLACSVTSKIVTAELDGDVVTDVSIDNVGTANTPIDLLVDGDRTLVLTPTGRLRRYKADGTLDLAFADAGEIDVFADVDISAQHAVRATDGSVWVLGSDGTTAVLAHILM